MGGRSSESSDKAYDGDSDAVSIGWLKCHAEVGNYRPFEALIMVKYRWVWVLTKYFPRS